jgi:BirA family transcriptional regulator, biotin operon repressor / biotin---[acetyl-CoA-carboxylase] ligase
MDPINALRQDSLTAAVRAAGIAVPPLFYQSIGSTNVEVWRLAEEGAPEWTVVAAGHQTAGKGRLGRSWVERPDRGLLLSVLLRPALPPDRAPLLSLLAASRMALVCRQLAGVEVACKWPNDLMVGGRKVGGILPEAKVVGSVLQHVVMGTGVNVSMEADDFPEDVRATATSLAVEGQGVHPALLVRGYLEGFRGAYRPDAEGFASDVVGEYRTLCSTLGRMVRAVISDGETVEGLATDLDDRGGLVVEVGDHRRTVPFGEVAHLGRPA